MDIHRCRFVPYPPQTISALSFSHYSDTKSTTPASLRLALGRASGDIEIWNPNGGDWFQETILRGGKDRSIEGLAWTEDSSEDENGGGMQLRLFSVGDSPSITEWSLITGTTIQHADSNSGDIWCLAVQPKLLISGDGAAGNTNSPQLLAAGCGNGNIVLFSTAEKGLQYVRSLGRPPVKKPKVLSITWRDRNTIVAGYDDSSIRVFDVQKRQNIRTMSLGPSAENNHTYVWCVRCLKDGTIVSGDSSGELKIWDATNFSLVQRLKTHEADILDIAANEKGDQIVTVGVDRRTVMYRPFVDRESAGTPRWAQLMHRRFHQHDVKALSSFESAELSVLASGGVDTIPMIAPLQNWQDEYQRALTNLPQRPQLCSSRSGRLLLTWWGREITLWRLNSCASNPTEQHDNNNSRYRLLLQLALKGEENITSAHISESGKLIVVSTVVGVKLFQLRWSSRNGTQAIRSRAVELPPTLQNFGAKIVRFSQDGRWISAVRLNNVVALAKIEQQSPASERPYVFDNIVKLTRKRRARKGDPIDTALAGYLSSVTHLEFSDDSRILATGDLSGAIDIWVLEGTESLDQNPPVIHTSQSEKSSDDSASDTDSESDDEPVIQGQKWIRNPSGSRLPQLGAAVMAMAFRTAGGRSTVNGSGDVGLHATRHNPHPVSHELPRHDTKLVAVTASQHIVEFDVGSCKLSEWSRRNPPSLLPNALLKIKDRTMGCFSESGSRSERLWLYGPTWLFMLDMSQDLPVSKSLGRLGDYDVLEPVTNLQRKRASLSKHTSAKRKRNTGAGDEMDDGERYIGVRRQVPTFKEADRSDERVLELVQPSYVANGELAQSQAQDDLLALRRRDEAHSNTGDLAHEAKEAGSSRAFQDPSTTRNGKRPGWWLSFNYRSIFGIAPIGTGAGDQSTLAENGDGEPWSVEVVIIERPMHDIDLAPRFDDRKDWDT